ncbi:MAG: hypothetical protein HFF31_10170 [Flavonifractor sp.]|nr:hypothetical protein [Flavonifractor sp.]
MYQCLCCGNYTLRVPADCALAFICPVCLWENDVFIHSDDEPSDENGGTTLQEARENYLKFGAAREYLIKHARLPTPEERSG